VDRVFLDANVLLSAARQPGARLQMLWRLSGVELMSSSQAGVAEQSGRFVVLSWDQAKALARQYRSLGESGPVPLPIGVESMTMCEIRFGRPVIHRACSLQPSEGPPCPLPYPS
jgi:hypothetical protein